MNSQGVSFRQLLVHHFRELVSESIHKDIPISRGQTYSWAWRAEISLSCIGFLFNTLTMVMMLLLPDSSKMPFFTLNVAINVIDLSFNLSRIGFASTYVHFGRVDGHPWCEIEAFSTIIIATMSMLTIVGISSVAKYDLCNGMKFSQRQMIEYLICAFFYSVIAACLCILLPMEGASPNPSATYCFLISRSRLSVPILIGICVIIPQAYLGHNLIKIFKAVSAAQKILDANGVKEVAKGPYIHMVTKLNYFFLASVSAYNPTIFNAFYQFTTGKYVPPEVSIFSGLCVISLQAFVNPSLFFFLNSDLRDTFWKHIGIHIARVLYKFGFFSLWKMLHGSKHSTRFVKGRNVISLFTKVHPSNTQESDGSTTKFEYDDVKNWLSDPILRKYFLDHSRKEYTIENFIFYEEVNEYVRKGLEIISQLETLLEMREKATHKPIPLTEDILEKWKSLEAHGTKIYTLCIAVPSAPLEINIPHGVREAIKRKLMYFSPESRPVLTSPKMTSVHITNSKNSAKGSNIDAKKEFAVKYLSLLDAWTSDSDVLSFVRGYTEIFNESLSIIYYIIECDIWPRFRQSSQLDSAIEEHRKKGQDIEKQDERYGIRKLFFYKT